MPEADLTTRSLIPFFAMTFGLAWGLFALMALAPGWVTATFGALSGHHPLFMLAVYAPAIAAFPRCCAGADATGTAAPGSGNTTGRACQSGL